MSAVSVTKVTSFNFTLKRIDGDDEVSSDERIAFRGSVTGWLGKEGNWDTE
jgi:hypothetical protein